MLSSRKSWSFTILIYWDFPKSWSQKWKVGVTYSKSGVNEISVSLVKISYSFSCENIILFILDIHWFHHITKTRLYNFDPLKPHFYIVKLGFTGVYIIFLISAQNIDCGFSLELPRWGGSNEYPQSMFWAEIWKISEFFIWKFWL